MSHQIRRYAPCVRMLVGFSLLCLGQQAMAQVTSKPDGTERNLVRNGSFREVEADGRPKGWGTAGHAGMQQSIALTDGPDGRKALKLVCTKFVPGFPDSHAMVLQMGAVELKKGQFYKLTWWAKGGRLPGETMPTVAAAVDIVDSAGWKKQFGQSFRVFPYWRKHEAVFQASADLPAKTSRLAFFVKSTCVLFLADVSLVEAAAPQLGSQNTQWWPQIGDEGVTNLLPNSSFECGTAGWGGIAPDIQGCGSQRTNLPAAPGEIDPATALHGRSSLRIRFDADKPITLATPNVSEQARQLAIANVGWIKLAAGERYVLSCCAKADQANTPVRLLVYRPGREIPDLLTSVSAAVGTDWRRIVLPVRAAAETFVWCAAGLDLSKSKAGAATVWLDALRFERGERPSDYRPRAAVESFVVAAAPGNTFTDPAGGLYLSIVASNAGDSAVTVKGRLSITDFADREVLARDVEVPVGARDRASFRVTGLLKGRRGFFRVAWQSADCPDAFRRTLRCAVIDPYPNSDSPFGMNTAYPWAILNRLAKEGGLAWMREWSASWDRVESRQGEFDFSFSDRRIGAILAEKLNALVLLPYAAARWSGDVDPQRIEREVDKEQARSGGEPGWRGWRDYMRGRILAGCAPRNIADFRNYVTRTVEHYHRQCRCFEVFNEPLDPGYALSSRFGYKVKDYVELLKAAYESAKGVDKDVQIIGGLSTWPSNRRPAEFIAQGGLQYCDAVNVHWYPDIGAGPEAGEKDLADLEGLIRAKGPARPIWVTEFGCYADDDPPYTPDYRIGDETMQRCQYASEREAAAGLVKYAALLFGHGTRKIFFHQGDSGWINGGAARGGADGAGVFFEYGGAPRKMYPALAALANLLGADFESVGSTNQGPAYAFRFRTKKGFVAVAWKNDYADGAEEGKPVSLRLPDGVSAVNLMGNALGGPNVELGEDPVYLLSADEHALQRTFARE